MPTKILTVDDSRPVRMVIERALGGLGWTICEAADGREALSVARREGPDLILLDLSMPVMDGMSLLRVLRQDPQLKATPVIILSAEPAENTPGFAELGVSDYLSKPFREQALLEKVRRVLHARAPGACNHPTKLS